MELTAEDAESVTIKMSRADFANLFTVLHTFSVEFESEPSRIDSELLTISKQETSNFLNAFFKMDEALV